MDLRQCQSRERRVIPSLSRKQAIGQHIRSRIHRHTFGCAGYLRSVSSELSHYSAVWYLWRPVAALGHVPHVYWHNAFLYDFCGHRRTFGQLLETNLSTRS